MCTKPVVHGKELQPRITLSCTESEAWNSLHAACSALPSGLCTLQDPLVAANEDECPPLSPLSAWHAVRHTERVFLGRRVEEMLEKRGQHILSRPHVSPVLAGPLGSSSGRSPRWPSSRTRACPTSKSCVLSWRAAFWTSRTTAPTCCMYFWGPRTRVVLRAGLSGPAGTDGRERFRRGSR